MKTSILALTALLSFSAHSYTYTCAEVSDMVRNTVFTEQGVEHLNKVDPAGVAVAIQSDLNMCQNVRIASERGMDKADIFKLVLETNKANVFTSVVSSATLLNASLSLN